ncbi:A/G-specific adenine glycosylase [Ornithinimicrobium sp. EGI L100131]|nr:A/G-specific adenine glycosylase [Ornithinimicrobium sediminis]MCE0485784.1 A/G-specific adenine glycosylase [Ornithinimicrobium sediminis]
MHRPVLDWYAVHARDLPWRRPECSPWGVLVSEVMLQQTPVSRVEPVWCAWLERWPTPGRLAEEPAGEAVRAWGRLGYPRRALRLHAAARTIRDEHGGQVPDDLESLRQLPGVGEYTAAAVRTFAYGGRAVVVDTNIRRVLVRALTGRALPAPALTRAETELAGAALPGDDAAAATWNVAVMELGALVCTARSPDCAACPVAGRCAWRRAGHPAYDGPPRRGQAWAGTDRQCRGVLVQVLREATTPVAAERLALAWTDDLQRERCLDALVADGLVEPLARRTYRLPG